MKTQLRPSQTSCCSIFFVENYCSILFSIKKK